MRAWRRNPKYFFSFFIGADRKKDGEEFSFLVTQLRPTLGPLLPDFMIGDVSKLGAQPLKTTDLQKGTRIVAHCSQLIIVANRVEDFENGRLKGQRAEESFLLGLRVVLS